MAILIVVGFITYMAYLLFLLSSKISIGKAPLAVVALLTAFSPIFGIDITYLLIFHTMALFVATAIKEMGFTSFYF